jgi:hypothetical protein
MHFLCLVLSMLLPIFRELRSFQVLDHNSAYYQIPLSAKSHKATAFCTSFVLSEFTTLSM